MRHLFLLALLLVFTGINSLVTAQQKEDVIYLADGQQKKGKIVAISDDEIKFSYTGEEVIYELKKDKVSKIIFANGREEIISTGSSTAKPIVTKDGTHSPGNLLAVLPFDIATNEQGLMTDAMRKKVQESCIEALQKQGLVVQFQDVRTTNALLAKGGINFADIGNHTPEELSQLLDVDYVVLGTYDIENKGVSTFGSGITSYDEKKKNDKEKGTAITSNNSYSTTNYNTKVHLSIYDAHGRQLFSDTRSPAFGGMDSFNSALKTLAKRVPLKR